MVYVNLERVVRTAQRIVCSFNVTVCGNGVCESGEGCENCPEDCGVCSFNVTVCGNGVCESGEGCENCPEDCGACPRMGARIVGLDEQNEILESINRSIASLENKTNRIMSTTEKIWNKFKKTNISVIVKEDIISKFLSNESAIVIDYTIFVPVKEGYKEGDFLPIRWKYWFIDAEGNCISQEESIIKPYCKPLIAETIAPAGTSINTRIRLRPRLKRGNYSIIREFEEDPSDTWISYGREFIGMICILEDSRYKEINLEQSMSIEFPENETKTRTPTGMVTNVGGDMRIGLIFIMLLVLLSLTFILKSILRDDEDGGKEYSLRNAGRNKNRGWNYNKVNKQ